MTTTVRLDQAGLRTLLQELAASGTRVVGPVRAKNLGRELVEYGLLENVDDLVLDGPPPARSAKELFLPATEALMCWHCKKGRVEIDEVPTSFPPTLLFGARPCDAAAAEILDRVMGWDYKDELWFGRRAATTVIALSCSGGDKSCFCTAVGLSPSSTRGADGLLTPVGKGYELEVLTPKAEALVAAHPKLFRAAKAGKDSSEAKSGKAKKGAPGDADAKGGKAPKDEAAQAAERAATTERVKGNLDVNVAAIRSWLETHFEHPLWSKLGVRCHGCGACAAVCPTCHCFDIMDELEGVDHGTRRRNWDTCQTSLFTVHGSGHNPRRDQGARLRQRVTHKFATYPKKFGETLCTGCGRCIRACAAGMDLIEVLGEIDGMARAPERAERGGNP